MLKYVDYDIVFDEVPDEVALAVSLSLCPNHCEGCHSPYLRQDIGEELTLERLASIIRCYRSGITCLCLMGGDGDTHSLEQLARSLRTAFPTLRLAWYSGRQQLPESMDVTIWDYVKLGPYIPKLGPLTSPTTNQRLYRILSDSTLDDLTPRFWRDKTSNGKIEATVPLKTLLNP
ncbi:MAG: anaerobic ribonucleoside-triphosphate reductase activating protein [Bacteroidaceae bacterium]|nr:anaerobic ribonucleoside-triphosphate reductase activating protein [Bacteroidaceae bacterium]